MGMFKCKDCDNYMLCEYYHNRKETSKICSEFVKDAIPEADYEARLKADMVAVLEELRLSIEELDYPKDCDYACNGCLYWGDVDNVIQQKINELPSVTPQEQKTGHWTTVLHEEILFCSECHQRLVDEQTYIPLHYCPNCGARMVEPQESEGT